MGLYFEGFQEGERHVTSARTITEADQVNFAGVGGNFDPMHLNEEGAAEAGYSGRLVYGLLTLSIMEGLKVQTGLFDDTGRGFYGMNHLRFVNPVYIGDTIRNEIEVVELEPRTDDDGLVTTREKGVKSDGETAVVYESKYLVERR